MFNIIIIFIYFKLNNKKILKIITFIIKFNENANFY